MRKTSEMGLQVSIHAPPLKKIPPPLKKGPRSSTEVLPPMRCRTCRTRGTEDRGVTQGVGHCDVVQCARHSEYVQGAKHGGAVQGAGYHDEVRGLRN